MPVMVTVLLIVTERVLRQYSFLPCIFCTDFSLSGFSMADLVFCILCLAVLGYLPAVGAIYHGGGRIITSYGDTYLFHSGIMIAYRPENVARCEFM